MRSSDKRRSALDERQVSCAFPDRPSCSHAAVSARRAAGEGRRGAPAAGRAVVRSVRLCEPADGVAEASAVVVDGGRVRALAFRLVGLDGRWRVEALQVG